MIGLFKCPWIDGYTYSRYYILKTVYKSEGVADIERLLPDLIRKWFSHQDKLFLFFWRGGGGSIYHKRVEGLSKDLAESPKPKFRDALSWSCRSSMLTRVVAGNLILRSLWLQALVFGSKVAKIDLWVNDRVIQMSVYWWIDLFTFLVRAECVRQHRSGHSTWHYFLSLSFQGPYFSTRKKSARVMKLCVGS